MTVELSVDEQRLLCNLVCNEIDNTNIEIREQSERGNTEDVKVLSAFKYRLKSVLETLKVKD